jgi:50S ribosome-binding GTPase
MLGEQKKTRTGDNALSSVFFFIRDDAANISHLEINSLHCSKSALINRLLGRRRARTANTPGVTRSLQWIRIRTDDGKKTNKKEYELLDSPGIIPSYLDDQSDALLLAACNCIGEASYDNQVSERSSSSPTCSRCFAQ